MHMTSNRSGSALAAICDDKVPTWAKVQTIIPSSRVCDGMGRTQGRTFGVMILHQACAVAQVSQLCWRFLFSVQLVAHLSLVWHAVAARNETLADCFVAMV